MPLRINVFIAIKTNCYSSLKNCCPDIFDGFFLFTEDSYVDVGDAPVPDTNYSLADEIRYNTI